MAYTLRYGVLGSVLLSIAYGIICIVGVCGNVAVVVVVAQSPTMRSPTNLFIANLAVADILVNILCLPFTLIGNLFPAWILGIFFCKTVSYLQGVSVSASVNTLTAISLERMAAINFPFLSGSMTQNKYKVAVIVIWFVALTINLPWLFVFKLEPLSPGSLAKVCIELWPTQQSGDIFFLIANLFICYLGPLMVISVCYVIIWNRVSNRRLPREIVVNRKNDIYTKSKMKVLKMLLVVILVFTFSWLPLYALCSFIKFFWVPRDDNEHISETIIIFLPIFQLLGATNSCINPILYAFMNHKFRVGFKNIISKNNALSIQDLEIKEINPRRGTRMIKHEQSVNDEKQGKIAGTAITEDYSYILKKKLIIEAL
ncbi:neuropeptide SIFamide receptor-like [Culicoides brevitarsis]|uniref:neuropeptide SIFamide receptor-like n=1 Tax=Culicoides brevitarsis TaxID=469753 RepID=UPI00307C307A